MKRFCTIFSNLEPWNFMCPCARENLTSREMACLAVKLGVWPWNVYFTTNTSAGEEEQKKEGWFKAYFEICVSFLFATWMGTLHPEIVVKFSGRWKQGEYSHAVKYEVGNKIYFNVAHIKNTHTHLHEWHAQRHTDMLYINGIRSTWTTLVNKYIYIKRDTCIYIYIINSVIM